MPVYPIPNDWAGVEWGCVLVEWPLSEQWFGILRGLVTTPVRGRFWDGSTGTITDAQAIGLAIEERNPIVSCEEIAAALLLINGSISALDISANLQIDVLNNIDLSANLIASSVSQATIDQTVALVAVNIASAQAEASAYAWSQAFATALVGIEIVNQFPTQFRPIEVGVDPPPQAAETTVTGITSVLEPTSSTEICKRVYWLLRDLRDYLIYLDDLNDTAAGTVLGLSGLLADALWYASFKANALGKRFLVPAAVFLNVTHRLQELVYEGINPFPVLRDWITDNYQSLTCWMTLAVEAGDSTDDLKQMLADSMTGDGVPAAYQFIPLVVANLSSLAALYYEAPALDPVQPIPASEPANICTACSG